jgi:NitT/TauT family transport system substrate-binding protein
MIGSNGFSSLAAKPEWLETDMAKAFMRAYAETRDYMNDTPAGETARAEASYFPYIDEAVLASWIATYQKLGCWSRHVEITPAAFEATMDIFEYNGLINQRFAYEQICAVPPKG